MSASTPSPRSPDGRKSGVEAKTARCLRAVAFVVWQSRRSSVVWGWGWWQFNKGCCYYTAHLRLAELLGGLGEVEDVVDDLEREPQMAPVLEHGVLHRLVHATKHSRGPVTGASLVFGVRTERG